MTNRLNTAIKNLYHVFSRYPGKSDMDGSPVYSDLAKWNQALFAKPLRELTEDDLSKFVGSVMLTWGDVDDFKHFLPRIFELTAQYPPYDVWFTFDKLNVAEWNKWTEEEQNPVKEYLLALWDNLLQDESKAAEWEFQDYFSSIANFYPDFTEIIAIWKDNKGKPSIKHLANFIFKERENLFDKGCINGMYKKKENVAELTTWLLSSEAIDSLGQSFFKFEKEDFAETLSWAEKILNDEKKNSPLQ